MSDERRLTARERLSEDLAVFELEPEDLDAALEFSLGVRDAASRVIAQSEQSPALAASAVGQLLASYSIDSEIEEATAAGHGPACARGCSACCHIPVSVSSADVASLLRWHAEQSRERQREIESRVEAALPRVTGQLPRGVVACPLLDEETGACEAYQARPLACRGCFSDDARRCVPGDEISSFVAPQVVARSASLGVGLALEEVDEDGDTRDLILALAQAFRGHRLDPR